MSGTSPRNTKNAACVFRVCTRLVPSCPLALYLASPNRVLVEEGYTVHPPTRWRALLRFDFALRPKANGCSMRSQYLLASWSRAILGLQTISSEQQFHLLSNKATINADEQEELESKVSYCSTTRAGTASAWSSQARFLSSRPKINVNEQEELESKVSYCSTTRAGTASAWSSHSLWIAKQNRSTGKRASAWGDQCFARPPSEHPIWRSEAKRKGASGGLAELSHEKMSQHFFMLRGLVPDMSICVPEGIKNTTHASCLGDRI